MVKDLCNCPNTRLAAESMNSRDLFKYRLIVSDLDGTLLDSRGKISDNTRATINEYQKRGGVFTIATGRMDESAGVFVDELDVKAPIISYNGAKVVNLTDGTVLSESFLNGEMAQKAYSALREINKDVVVYYDGTPHITELNEVTQKYMKRINFKAKLVEDIHENSNPFSKKMLVIDPKKEFELIRLIAKEAFGDMLNCVISDEEYFEILPPETSKGHGLRVIADYLEIPMAEVIAIGDYMNDLSMIEEAGLGVAVQNAAPEVLAAADYITLSNDEDGVAQVIIGVIDGSMSAPKRI